MADEQTNVNQTTEQNGGGTPAQSVVVLQQPQQGSKAEASTNQQGLFTQEQLNLIIQSRVNPLNEKIANLSKELANAKTESANFKAQVESFAQKEQAKKLGIADEFVDFAIFNAQKLAVNGKTFEVALGEYAESNKKLLQIPDNTQGSTGNGSSPSQPNTPMGIQTKTLSTNAGNSAGSNTSTIEAQVNDFLKRRGLKR